MANLNSSELEGPGDFNASRISNSTEINEPLILSPKDLEVVREKLFFGIDDSFMSESTENQSMDQSQMTDEINSSDLLKDVSSHEIEEPTMEVAEVAPKPRRGRKSIAPQQVKEETVVVVQKRTRKPPKKMSRGIQMDQSKISKPTRTRASTKTILSSIEENGQDGKTAKNPPRMTRAKKEATNGTLATKENDGVKKEKVKKKAAPSKPTNRKTNKVAKEEIEDLQKAIHNLSTHQEEDSILSETLTESLEENGSAYVQNLQVLPTNETRDPSPKVTVTKASRVESQKDRRRTYVITVEVPEDDECPNGEWEGSPVKIKKEKSPSPPEHAQVDKAQATSREAKSTQPEKLTFIKSEGKPKQAMKGELETRKQEIRARREEFKRLVELKKMMKKELKKEKEKIKAAKLKMMKYKKQGRRGRYHSDSDSSTTSSSSSYTSSSLSSSLSSSSSSDRKVRKRR